MDCWEIPIFSLPGNFPPAPTTKILQESAAAGSFKDPAFPPGTSPFHRAHSSKRRTQQQNHPRSRLSLLKWSPSRLLGALVRPHTYNQTHHATDATASATGGQLQAVRMGYGFICLCQTGGAACHSRWCMSDCRVRQASGAPHPGGKDDAFVHIRSLISCRRCDMMT